MAATINAIATINSNGTMVFGNTSGGSVTIAPKNDTATNYTLTIPDVDGTLSLVDSQAFTGTPTAPTATAGTNNTQLATTAYVDGKMVLGTSLASTSGTSIDFTGIPAWTKRITIMFNGVSTNNSSLLILQLGSNSVGIETSGYFSTRFGVSSGSTFNQNSSQGFIVGGAGSGATASGLCQLCAITTNSWIHSSVMAEFTNVGAASGGNKYISSILDRIRITTVNGTDTFDAGSINIMYEG
jgi:hypothetical protein